MAIRLLRYLAELYGSLIAEGQEPPLPAVVPLLRCTGDSQWSAARSISEMIRPDNAARRSPKPSSPAHLFATKLKEYGERLTEEARKEAWQPYGYRSLRKRLGYLPRQ